jgi:drug/metabolite transporter (DMT)-like permease
VPLRHAPHAVAPPDTLVRMPFGLLTGLGAALAWGTLDLASALAARRLGSLVVATAVQVVSALLLVAVVIVTGTAISADPVLVLTATLLGAAGAGAYVAYFTGLRVGPIAVVSGMVAAYGGLTVVLAVIVRGESLTLLQAGGAALATVGVILAAVAFDGHWRNTRLAGPGVAFAIVALVLFSIMTVGLAELIDVAGWLEVLTISRVANAVLTLAVLGLVLVAGHPRLRVMMERELPVSPRAWALVVVGGVLDVTGLVSLAVGLDAAPTWLVGLASSFGPAVTIVAAVALLGERLRAVQWLGLGLVAAGLVAIALP